MYNGASHQITVVFVSVVPCTCRQPLAHTGGYHTETQPTRAVAQRQPLELVQV